MGNHLNLALALLADLHRVTQIPNAAIDLDFVMEEFFESRDVEDFIRGGL